MVPYLSSGMTYNKPGWSSLLRYDDVQEGEHVHRRADKGGGARVPRPQVCPLILFPILQGH